MLGGIYKGNGRNDSGGEGGIFLYVGIYCQIITISLANIHHHSYDFFFLVMRTLKIYSLNDFQINHVTVLTVQADLRGTVRSAPDHSHKASIPIKQVIILFAGGGSCSQFAKNTTSEKRNKAKRTK